MGRKRDTDALKTLREDVEAIGRKRNPEADAIKAGFYDGYWYVEVWRGTPGSGSAVATMDFIPVEALL